MTAVVFELLAERSKRKPRDPKPEERAAHHVSRALRGVVDGDLIEIAQEEAAFFLAAGEQMQCAIDRAVRVAKASMRLRRAYKDGRQRSM